MPSRTKALLPVGSAQWIQDENRQISQFGVQETEDFTFSARNEVEWLNEHMADIFSKNQVNITEIFKTPGKLRGKTPRTNRKRNPLQIRQPLTDIFSTNAPQNSNPSHPKPLRREVSEFQVAKDPRDQNLPSKASQQITDSGYHGSEDDMDIGQTDAITSQILTVEQAQRSPVPEKSPARSQEASTNLVEEQRTTEGSFHSAKEDMTGLENPKEPSELAVEEHACNDPEPEIPPQSIPGSFPLHNLTTAEALSEDPIDLGGIDNESALEDNNSIDPLGSPSEGSSPVKPLIRKSSLTFAALPAREPLTTKKSIGSRVSGTTHLEQSRATMSRGSLLGRYTSGKSLGGVRQPDHVNNETEDSMDTDQAEMPHLSREESDGDTKMARLHNKSSTQRLHEKINMLGKSQPARPTKSVPAAAIISHPTYPDLPQFDAQPPTSEQPSSNNVAVNGPDDHDDDDDWIQPPQLQAKDSRRPQLKKSISTDIKEKNEGKGKINDQQPGVGDHDRYALKTSSPLPQSAIPQSQKDLQGLSRVEPVANDLSSSKTSERSSAAILEKSITITEPVSKNGNGAQASTTPVGTPSSKRYVDGPLSASKSKIQSIMKTARGLFTSSAGVSAQAKMETLSPHAVRTRSQAQGQKGGDMMRTKPKGPPADNGMCPAQKSGKQVQVVISKSQTNTPTKNTEGRKTRGSTEKEEKRKEQEAKERERVDLELERARETESRKAAAQWQEDAKDARANLNPNAEVEQAGSSSDGQPSRPTRQSPRRVQMQQEAKKTLEPLETQINNVENNSINNAMAPPPTHLLAQPSQLQRPKDLRRPVKPAKETAPKSKPQPVAIRVGTLSQRIPLTNAALSSSLSESLAPPPKQPDLIKKASNISLQTSSSNNSLKSSVTSSAPKPKALLAAERKKEQDEREAHRKLEQKRENERKRAAQQEELRRQEQAHRQELERQREKERAVASEDPKKIAQRQAIEKRRLEVGKKEHQRQATQQAKSQPFPAINRSELGGVRHPSKLHTVQDYSRPLPNQPPCNPAKPATKRVFEPEAEDEPVRPVRMAGGPPYQQTDKKRRRTEDEDVQELMVRPPIRQSNIRKDAPKQSIFSSYSGAQQPSTNYHQSSSMVKTAALNQTYQQHQQPSQAPRPGPFNEMAKYTAGKIPFAETPNPPSKSPLRAKQPAAPPAKSSPQFINGENIELEDIPTDSDEEDSEDEKAKGAMLADWAQSPELRKILEEQERNANADEVFGPAGSPHMEEMFKERRDRFRNRTSSANWNGSDRLTEEEIRNDRAGRERLRKQGGWVFGL